MSVQKVVQGLSYFLPMGAMAAVSAFAKDKQFTTANKVIYFFEHILTQRLFEKLAYSFFKHYISSKPEYKVIHVAFSVITSFALMRIFSFTQDNFNRRAAPCGAAIIGETGFHLLTSGKYAKFCFPIFYKLLSK